MLLDTKSIAVTLLVLQLTGDEAADDVSVTNPSLYTFGTSLTDNDKQGHTICKCILSNCTYIITSHVQSPLKRVFVGDTVAKVSHTDVLVVSESVSKVSGTDAYTMMITEEGKLMFRGNADEIGTGAERMLK